MSTFLFFLVACFVVPNLLMLAVVLSRLLRRGPALPETPESPAPVAGSVTVAVTPPHPVQPARPASPLVAAALTTAAVVVDTNARVRPTVLKTTPNDLDRWEFTAKHAGVGMTNIPVVSLLMLLNDARVAHRLSSRVTPLQVRTCEEEASHVAA